MPRTIRFHLDEHVLHAVAEGMRMRGIDVTTTTDADLLGTEDGAQIGFGLAQGRVIFTEDEDFLVWAAEGKLHAGVVYCHQNRRSIGQIIRALELIWDSYEPNEMQNRVEFISGALHRLAAIVRSDILRVSKISPTGNVFGVVFMAKACEVCGKSPQMGNSITTRGKAKYLGGVGTKITGISRRQFKPNLQRIRVTVQGSNKSMRVCTQCIRSGAVTKLVRAAPFKLPTDAAKAAGKGDKKATKSAAKAKSPAKVKAAKS